MKLYGAIDLHSTNNVTLLIETLRNNRDRLNLNQALRSC